MKILALETFHPSGIKELEKSGYVDIFYGKSRSDVLNVIDKYDVIIVKSVTKVDSELIDTASNLKIVGRAGTGTDNIDKAYLKERGVTLLTTPTGNSVSAAEFAVMQILCLVKNAYESQLRLKNNDFRRDLLIGRELSAMTIGIVGYGTVGKEVAKKLKPFGCEIVVYDINIAKGEESGITFVDSLSTLIPMVDLLTLHATLNPTSHKMINEEILSSATPGLLIVNTARGELIDNSALLNAIDMGIVERMAIDTLDDEPPYNLAPNEHQYDHAFLHHPRIFVTPHMAASTSDAQEKIAFDLSMQIVSSYNKNIS